jgi:hypothetical protein
LERAFEVDIKKGINVRHRDGAVGRKNERERERTEAEMVSETKEKGGKLRERVGEPGWASESVVGEAIGRDGEEAR